MKNYLTLIRTKQYVKNVFVFAPLFFSGEFLHPNQLSNTVWAFVLFCMAASSIYIINDFADIHEDRLHPQKSKRPLAAGLIPTRHAVTLMTVLLVSALLFSLLLSRQLFWIILGYVVLNILYSKWLKHIAILDVNIIAIGFVLRLLAGVVVSEITPSIWILLITYLLALFLGFAKRRSDVLLAAAGIKARKNINGYNLPFIDIILGVLSSIIIVSYIFYCIAPEHQDHYNSELLYVSIIFVINGIFRYLKLALVDQSTYSPTLILLKDRFLQITILSWILLMAYLLYVR